MNVDFNCKVVDFVSNTQCKLVDLITQSSPLRGEEKRIKSLHNAIMEINEKIEHESQSIVEKVDFMMSKIENSDSNDHIMSLDTQVHQALLKVMPEKSNLSNGLLLSMNEKILSLAGFCEQMRGSLTSRMQVLEEKISFACKSILTPSPETKTSTSSHADEIFRNGISELEGRLSRIARESQSNYDVAQGWFVRIHELVKNMQRHQIESSSENSKYVDQKNKLWDSGMTRITRIEQQLDKLYKNMESIERQLSEKQLQSRVDAIDNSVQTLYKKNQELSSLIETLLSKVAKSEEVSKLSLAINSLNGRISALENCIDERQTSKPQITSENTLKIVESIHSTLVSYLPMDGGHNSSTYMVQELNQKIDSIISRLPTATASHRQTPANLLDLQSRQMQMSQALDSIQTSVNGLVEAIKGQRSNDVSAFKQVVSGINRAVGRQDSLRELEAKKKALEKEIAELSKHRGFGKALPTIPIEVDD